MDFEKIKEMVNNPEVFIKDYKNFKTNNVKIDQQMNDTINIITSHLGQAAQAASILDIDQNMFHVVLTEFLAKFANKLDKEYGIDKTIFILKAYKIIKDE